MSEPLDESYFKWLYSQVDDVEETRKSKTCWNFLREFFIKEFVWFVPNDDNRLEDGRDLRYEFVESMNIQEVDITWTQLGCSMLELMIGLSRRLTFEAEGNSRDWFWTLVSNLGLRRWPDSVVCPKDKIDEVLDRVIFRNYDSRGRGGFFPLRKTRNDQRTVELWYQLSEYVL